MTEQEAEAWAARWEKIWTPERVTFPDMKSRNQNLELIWRGELGVGSYVEVKSYPGELRIELMCGVRGFAFDTRYGGIHPLTDSSQVWDHFEKEGSASTDKYVNEFGVQLPFFRRGCWLSGCPIEASAHEKAEWMQGFSREEIEAWNLNF